MLATIDPLAPGKAHLGIHWYLHPLSYLVSYLPFIWLSVESRKVDPENILDFILLAFPIAIVGARLYVIFQWSYYSHNPSEIFAIWNGRLPFMVA